MQLEACEAIRTKPIMGSIRSDKRLFYKKALTCSFARGYASR